MNHSLDSSDFGSDSQSSSDLFNDENVEDGCDVHAVSVCCPLVQLATLSYIDVALKTDRDPQDLVVKGTVDTGAEVPVVKASLLPYPKLEVVGRNKLRPFCGESVSIF